MLYFIKCIIIGAMCGASAYYGFPAYQTHPLKLSALAVLLVFTVMTKKRWEPAFHRQWDRLTGGKH